MIDALQFSNVYLMHIFGDFDREKFVKRHAEIRMTEEFDVRSAPEQKAPAHRACSVPQSSASEDAK
jgi:hypothetical protein